MDLSVMTWEQYEEIFGPSCKRCGGPIDKDTGEFVCAHECHDDDSEEKQIARS